MFTLNGFGATFIGECDYEPDGTYITTAWIVALWIPLIPLYSARILSAESTMLSGTNYQIIKLPIHWRQAGRIWAYVLGMAAMIALMSLLVQSHDIRDLLPPLLSEILSWVVLGALLPYAFLPFFLRYRARKAVGLTSKSRTSPITWLLLLLVLVSIIYVIFFADKL